MAARTITNPVVAKGGHMETINKLILTGQVWKAGEFLTITEAGLLRKINDAPITSNGGVKYYALTDQANPGNSTTYAKVGIITPTTEFEGNTEGTAVNDSDVGDVVHLASTADPVTAAWNNITVTSGTPATTGAAIITAIASDYNRIQNPAADTNARVRFRIPASVIDALPTDS
jgi:hypothetical protein